MSDSTQTVPGESDPRQALKAVALRLARERVTDARPLRDVLKVVTEIAAAALQVKRVSVWFFVDEPRSIRCDYLYQPDRGNIYEGAILHARDFPVYFSVLESSRVVRFVDRGGDPMSEEFRASYLSPLGITAMLDAPILQGGDIIGIVCHEHVGSAREWTDPECEFAASVGDIVARLYAEAERLRAESALEAQQTRLAELQQFGEMGRLAAGVAHDFNNVLNVIYAYVDLIADAGGRNPEVNRLAAELASVADRGRELTHKLMTLGRVDVQRPRVVSPADVLNDSLPLLRGAAGPRVRVETHVPPHVSRIFIDPVQLERAVVNLVVNARDAMPAGGVVTVELREESVGHSPDRQSTFVALEVSDTGVGMDTETRARMFETFFSTKGTKGHGLGMSIVNQIITLAGGFIQVDSYLGKGTSVRLYLPSIA
ncbi:MAG TPA: ATP-binding protein [Vicinamibacterales bacterium]|jgi:two-component system, cell cycle sensor histidine kinase and response regulator CckA|nr:ATP-binding protein [Vicinamibacterales bacterium]